MHKIINPFSALWFWSHQFRIKDCNSEQLQREEVSYIASQISTVNKTKKTRVRWDLAAVANFSMRENSKQTPSYTVSNFYVKLVSVVDFSDILLLWEL